jgi:hypothetical protein
MLGLPALVAEVLQKIFDEGLHGSKVAEGPPPRCEYFFRVAARVQNGQHANFLRLHKVKNAVGKTVQIQAADAAEADGVKQGALTEFPVGVAKFGGELKPKTGTLLLIPVVSGLEISAYEPMIF